MWQTCTFMVIACPSFVYGKMLQKHLTTCSQHRTLKQTKMVGVLHIAHLQFGIAKNNNLNFHFVKTISSYNFPSCNNAYYI
jgi:hypothetical protein